MSLLTLRRPRRNTLLLSTLLACHLPSLTSALFLTGSSSAVQDPFINPPSTTCPVSQDGATSDTFFWTHNPTCVTVVLPSSSESGLGTHQDFCAYTNAVFASARGISFVTTPETAASLTAEIFRPFEDGIAWERELYEEKETEGKGAGLFATMEIKAGDTLIKKTPVLFVAKEVLVTPSRSRRALVLDTAVRQLPERTRNAFMGLAKSLGKEEAIEDIVLTNGFGVKVWDGTSHLVVVPEAAKINHACRPNAHKRFDDFTLGSDIFAMKDIKKGEEITMSYGFSTHPHPLRQEALLANWGFTCTCSLCTSPTTTLNASDTHLTQIRDLKAVLPSEPSDIPQLLGLLPDLISLLDEEDLILERPMYEEILAYTWSSFGIEERAKYWAGRAQQDWSTLAGKESWEAKRTRELESDVKAHATWMSWEGDPWEGVGQGHPWDEKEGDDHHDHDH
ncbi:hypothetical protein BDV95DRAFT_541144 [Massariosphaeria phaeospora]|uniref:SET domain-containing protein n=1 Tax=Massariosphaeria phaeospora TaxID=100035 RepID=A0A7C8MAQ7_9PLEO|nr:hypothetical protein BDV95DRAFT_541144 [Massariosphaeria phaeospora]